MKAADLRDALAMVRQEAEKYREQDDVIGATARMVDLRCLTAVLLVAEHSRGTEGPTLLKAFCVETAACVSQAIAALFKPEYRAHGTAYVLTLFADALMKTVARADDEDASVRFGHAPKDGRAG